MVSKGLVYDIIYNDTLPSLLENGTIQAYNATNGNLRRSFDVPSYISFLDSFQWLSMVGYHLFVSTGVESVFTRYDVRNGSFVDSKKLAGVSQLVYATNDTHGNGIVFIGVYKLDSSGVKAVYSGIQVFGADNFTTIRSFHLPNECLVYTITSFDRWVFGGCSYDAGDFGDLSGNMNAPQDYNIYQYDYYSGTLVKNFTGHTSDVYTLAVFNQTYLYSGSYDGTLRKWDLKSTGKQGFALSSMHLDSFQVLLVSVTNTYLFAMTPVSIYVLDIHTLTTLLTLPNGNGDAMGMIVDEDEGVLYVSYMSGTITKWSMSSCSV